MATKVIMPKAGMAMEEGTVVKWFKKEGAFVEAGEILLEITTDKVNMEVEAETSGTLLKILAKEWSVVPVFQTIAYIGEAGESVDEITEHTENVLRTEELINAEEILVEEKNQNKKDDESRNHLFAGKKRATPAARAEARARNLDLEKITGSGPNGRIQRSDVLAYQPTSICNSSTKATPLAKKIAAEHGLSLNHITGSGHAGKIRSEDVKKQISSGASQSLQDELIPMSTMRQVIAKRMSESYFTAPVFTLEIEVDMLKAKNLLDDLKTPMLEKYQLKPTVTDLIILATTRAIEKFPQLNASLEGDFIRRYAHVNMALAVGLDEGLMVPVIPKVDELSFHELVAKRTDIVERTLSAKLLPDETIGSSFTISNLGMYGIKFFTSIINQPNSAILGVGAMIDTVVPRDGQIVVRPMMSLILTIDHRVVDGAKGAEFLSYLKNILESPAQLFV